MSGFENSKIKKIKGAFFSPTGNVKRIIYTMVQSMGKELDVPVEYFDFTALSMREKTLEVDSDTLLILGTPVYAGRVPNKILPFIQENIKGNGGMVIPVVSFGNRSFDDALMELVLESENNGFRAAAAAAVVSEHAFAENLASGSPTKGELAEIKAFASQIALNLDEIAEKLAEGKHIKVDGNNPVGPYYTPLGLDGEPAKFLKAKPKTDSEKCIGCMTCARSCPMQSIDYDDVTLVTGICIKCQACISICPTDAKYMDDPAFLSHKAMLEKTYREKKSSKFFSVK